MRLVRTIVVSSLAALVLALAAAPAGAQETPTLVDVRAGRHPGFDRVVFEFRGAVPEHRIDYVDRLVQDGSGNRVTVAGAADLEVVLVEDVTAAIRFAVSDSVAVPLSAATTR